MVKKKTISRLESLHSKLIETGITADKATQFTKKQWNDAFSVKGKKIKTLDSLKGAKRLLSQINDKQDVVIQKYVQKHNITNKKYIKFIKKETERLFEDLKEKPGIYKTTKIKGKYYKVVVKSDGIKESTNIFYIKSTSAQDFKRQLDIIKKNYGVVKVFKPKRVKYKEFINLEKFAAFVES